jgi:hypothetical protein
MASHLGTRLRQKQTCASRQLWSHKRSPVRLARAHLAWSSGNHRDVDTLKSSACPLAGWLVSRPSPGTTFYPCQSIGGLGTQYCVRQRRHDHRSSEAPHLSKRWVHHPEPSRALQSTGKRQLCEASLPWLPSSHATQPPLSGHVPSRGLRPWNAEQTAEESPGTSRRQARAVSGWRSQESPHPARTAREQ